MNFFKKYVLTLIMMCSGALLYGNVDSMLMQQELPSDPHDELGFLVRFSVDEEEQSTQEQNNSAQGEELTDVTMFDILRFALTGCAHLYLSLNDDEKDDVIKMATELLSLRTMVEEYCDTCLKYNDLMLKYKEYKNVDTMSMHAAIGCKSCDDTGCEYVANEMPFSMKTFLQDASIQEFYLGLSHHEQKQYKRIVRGMEDFCHDVIKTVGIITDHYPSLKSNMKKFLDDAGLTMMLNVRFDHPFPSVTYQVL